MRKTSLQLMDRINVLENKLNYGTMLSVVLICLQNVFENKYIFFLEY